MFEFMAVLLATLHDVLKKQAEERVFDMEEVA